MEYKIPKNAEWFIGISAKVSPKEYIEGYLTRDVAILRAKKIILSGLVLPYPEEYGGEPGELVFIPPNQITEITLTKREDS